MGTVDDLDTLPAIPAPRAGRRMTDSTTPAFMEFEPSADTDLWNPSRPAKRGERADRGIPARQAQTMRRQLSDRRLLLESDRSSWIDPVLTDPRGILDFERDARVDELDALP